MESIPTQQQQRLLNYNSGFLQSIRVSQVNAVATPTLAGSLRTHGAYNGSSDIKHSGRDARGRRARV